MAYDKDNIFAKILRGEIPSEKIYEDDYTIAINDLYPKAKVHILVLSKGEYIDMEDFSKNASAEEIAGLFKAVGEVAREAGLEESGYRMISNIGTHGRQEIPHLHIHILGGEKIGKLNPAKQS